LRRIDETHTTHSFTDKTNLKLQALMWHPKRWLCLPSNPMTTYVEVEWLSAQILSSMGALEARGRTWGPLERHFESHRYAWGPVYRYGGDLGQEHDACLNVSRHTGHYKLERLGVPMVAIMHAQASRGYALTGSRQGKTGR